jgi:hypothetical protein
LTGSYGLPRTTLPQPTPTPRATPGRAARDEMAVELLVISVVVIWASVKFLFWPPVQPIRR